MKVAPVDRKEFWERLRKGEKLCCPMCDRTTAAWRRSVSLSDLRALNLLRQLDDRNPDEFVHLSHATTAAKIDAGNVTTLMRHWGLIEAKNPHPETEKDLDGGYYRITPGGRRFLKGEIDIPKYMYSYQGEVWGFSDGDCDFDDGLDEWITIGQVRHFDLSEVLA